jgi:hypothetical protein
VNQNFITGATTPTAVVQRGEVGTGGSEAAHHGVAVFSRATARNAAMKSPAQLDLFAAED